MVDVSTQKSALREKMTALRDGMCADQREKCALQLADNLSFFEKLTPSSSIAFYMPIAHEIDPRPLARALAGAHALCLPVVVEGQKVLTFRSFEFGDDLKQGKFGVSEPLETKKQVLPQVLLMPLLAADDRGTRLGYGGGYYDHTLAALRQQEPALAIGLAFETQMVEKVPKDTCDIKLDILITEKMIRKF